MWNGIHWAFKLQFPDYKSLTSKFSHVCVCVSVTYMSYTIVVFFFVSLFEVLGTESRAWSTPGKHSTKPFLLYFQTGSCLSWPSWLQTPDPPAPASRVLGFQRVLAAPPCPASYSVLEKHLTHLVHGAVLPKAPYQKSLGNWGAGGQEENSRLRKGILNKRPYLVHLLTSFSHTSFIKS